jgi:enoyl-CoA hydratase
MHMSATVARLSTAERVVSPHLRVAADQGVATITLHRPPTNALTAPIVAELARLFREIEVDPAIRAVVLTGGVRNAFCSGGDLASLFGEEMREKSEAQRLRLAQEMQTDFEMIEQHSKPVVAAINGIAFGAGLELALLCDFRVASELAYFALPELGHHIIPALGATLRLAPIVGLGRAKDMLMTGRRLRADEALSWGLVHALAPRSETLERALRFARALGAASREAFAALKRSIHRGLLGSPDVALREESREFAALLNRRLASEGRGRA